MKKPTIQEYEEALEAVNQCEQWLIWEHKRREALLDKLISSQKHIKSYEENLEKAKKIVLAYECYKETTEKY